MKPEILVMGPLLPATMAELEENFLCRRYWEAADKPALLAELAPRVTAIATSGFHGCTAAVMDALPKLKTISCFAVGVDAIDVPHATRRGIKVTNTPDVLNDAVAELTLAFMVNLARKFVFADRYVRDGKWLKAPYPLTSQLAGKRVGILGLGRIGKEIAQRCRAFKMSVAYHGRHEQKDQPYRYYADLIAMARDADYLVVIAPQTKETEGIVGRAVLEALGPKGALINVSRGGLVDETALVECLATGKLGGAGLDVFVAEPKVPEALLAMENVVLQPHTGSASVETRTAMGRLVVENLRAYFAGKPPLTPVN